MKQRTLFALVFVPIFVYSISAQAKRREVYGIVADNTGSMRSHLEVEIEIAKELVKQMKDSSLISFFHFDGDPNPKVVIAKPAAGTQCTADKAVLLDQIDNLSIIQGQTTLWDLIKFAFDRLNSAKPGNCGTFVNRNLVLITDGDDRASTIKLADLMSTLIADGARVYVVGLVDELFSRGNSFGRLSREESRTFLEKLAKETGGKAVFPKRNQPAKEVVKELFGTDGRPVK